MTAEDLDLETLLPTITGGDERRSREPGMFPAREGHHVTETPGTRQTPMARQAGRRRRSDGDPNDPNRLAADHLDLVTQIVNQIAVRYPRHVDRSELWSAGAAGLVEASRSYRPETGIPFARYASIRVRGSIIDSTRKRDWAVRSLRRRMRELNETEERFEVSEGRKPSEEELARLLGVSVEELHAQRAQSLNAALLHLDQNDPEKVPLGERIEERSTDRLPDQMLDRRELAGTLTRAVEGLPPLQREVIERYYIGGEMLQSIASTLGVTEARVSQIRAEAVNAMRSWFTTLYDGVAEVPEDAPGRRGRAAYLATLATASTWRDRLSAADEGFATAARSETA